MTQSKMKTREYKRYSDEFKAQAVRLSQQPEKSAIQVAKELGISKSVLAKWRKEAGVSRPNALLSKKQTEMSLDEENRLLRHQLRQAKMEMEILKKAAAYFAKESL